MYESVEEISNMNDDQLRDELSWMETIFRSCEEIGQGISTKDSVYRNRLESEAIRRKFLVSYE